MRRFHVSAKQIAAGSSAHLGYHPNRVQDALATALAMIVMLAVPAWSAPPLMKPLLDTYCMDCHDSETHKGGLNLADLAYEPAHRGNASTWERIFDRVAKGEMPPKNKTQPAAEEKAAWTSALAAGLRSASLEMQREEGRGPVRRLTRTEYENTIHDLLHIECDLKGLFPDDAVTAGFDKVGEGLTLSATHFARYQEAAEKALADAIYHAGVMLLAGWGPFLQGNEKTFTRLWQLGGGQ